MTGTPYVSLFERGEHDTSLAARSSSVPGETNTRDDGSLSLVVVKLPHRSLLVS